MTVPTPALLDTLEDFRAHSIELIRRLGVDDMLTFNLRQGVNETIDKNIARLATPSTPSTPPTTDNDGYNFTA